METGYIADDANPTVPSGIIWLRFLLRSLKNTGPSESDLAIEVGN